LPIRHGQPCAIPVVFSVLETVLTRLLNKTQNPLPQAIALRQSQPTEYNQPTSLLRILREL